MLGSGPRSLQATRELLAHGQDPPARLPRRRRHQHRLGSQAHTRAGAYQPGSVRRRFTTADGLGNAQGHLGWELASRRLRSSLRLRQAGRLRFARRNADGHGWPGQSLRLGRQLCAPTREAQLQPESECWWASHRKPVPDVQGRCKRRDLRLFVSSPRLRVGSGRDQAEVAKRQSDARTVRRLLGHGQVDQLRCQRIRGDQAW